MDYDTYCYSTKQWLFQSVPDLTLIKMSIGPMLFDGSSDTDSVTVSLSSYCRSVVQKKKMLQGLNLWNRCTNIMVKSPWLLSLHCINYFIITFHGGVSAFVCRWHHYHRLSPLSRRGDTFISTELYSEALEHIHPSKCHAVSTASLLSNRLSQRSATLSPYTRELVLFNKPFKPQTSIDTLSLKVRKDVE